MEPIRFMTFNARFDTELDEEGGNRWKDRVASVIETVTRDAPHIVGFQEALRSQLGDLTSSLDGYRAVGRPREVGDTAEYVPLFFHTDRVELEEHGDFWLSPTPEIEGSRGWDTDVPRHCTWGKVVDRESGVPFAVFNTHLDVWGKLARSEAAKIIINRAALAPDLPTVVMGDFNADEDSEPLELFRSAGFRDTLRVAHPHAIDVQTVHHYVELTGPRKIDYIMCDRRWAVVEAGVIREPAAGRLPSDHFPVVAELVVRGG